MLYLILYFKVLLQLRLCSQNACKSGLKSSTCIVYLCNGARQAQYGLWTQKMTSIASNYCFAELYYLTYKLYKKQCRSVLHNIWSAPIEQFWQVNVHICPKMYFFIFLEIVKNNLVFPIILLVSARLHAAFGQRARDWRKQGTTLFKSSYANAIHVCQLS